MTVYQLLRTMGIEVPLCLDVNIKTRPEYDLAKWLASLPSFYYKPGECKARILRVSPYNATLEILRIGK